MGWFLYYTDLRHKRVSKFDIYLLETFLNSEFLTDGNNLQTPGYINARVDHLSNTKWWSMCLSQNLITLIDLKYL